MWDLKNPGEIKVHTCKPLFSFINVILMLGNNITLTESITVWRAGQWLLLGIRMAVVRSGWVQGLEVLRKWAGGASK